MPNVIHPAKRMSFDELMSGLAKAKKQQLVYETRNAEGLLLYVYSNKCVYDSAWDDFTKIARGLIVDPFASKIVALPFPKFFNVEEASARIPDLPFETFEKLDGSLIIIFYSHGRWQAATKGAFNSEQAQWAQSRLDSTDLSKLVIGTTYLAEATYAENRIVILYKEAGLVLLAAYKEDGVELSYDEILNVSQKLGWRAAGRQDFASISDLLTTAKSLPRDAEGFVLRFDDGTRLKIKGAEYKRMHALVSRVTPLAIWEALYEGDDLQSMRRDLPEEFWGDFDSILTILNTGIRTRLKQIEDLANNLAPLSDKEVGLQLHSIDAALRPLIFTYRKSGLEALTNGRARQTVLRDFRPSGNILSGYSPSWALKRAQEEST